MERLHLFDSLSREVKRVEPSDGETLRFYCCGPTVYGPAHIGNFRTFVLQDVFRRVVESSGQATRHVRNLTDVDDKTIRASQEEGQSLSEFTQHWTAVFHKDCAALGLLEPAVEPAATAHLEEQLEIIADLIEKGHAYRAEDGSVYYDVDSFPDYGKLSRLSERTITTDTASGPERETSDEYDRDSAADFALWKARREEDGPNFWDSPWGEGRPGWHLECSAMSLKHLGDTLDLHSGGIDLLFPHHENEIAQSEAYTGKRFSNHWFHTTHLLVDGAKMAKSLGNLYTLEQLSEMGHAAETVRYLLLSAHYRQPLNFTLDSLGAAKKAIDRLRELKEKLGQPEQTSDRSFASFGPFQPVIEALNQDLNTPEALGQLFKIAKQLQRALANQSLSPNQLDAARVGFEQVCFALGLRLEAETVSDAPPEITALAQARWEAKAAKDWDRADEIRDAIAAAGWQVKDAKDGYELMPVD
ncbi:MAG: cysteine--tRNA ligase [Verrucomicrobiota bacterium]